jgi:hypothetical protein
MIFLSAPIVYITTLLNISKEDETKKKICFTVSMEQRLFCFMINGWNVRRTGFYQTRSGMEANEVTQRPYRKPCEGA